jgi:hypothetical protein
MVTDKEGSVSLWRPPNQDWRPRLRRPEISFSHGAE